MKTKRIFFSLIIALALSLNSCNDYLDIKPNNLITGSSLTEDNLPALTAPLYNKVWFDFNDKFYYGLGDGMAYNLYAPYSDYIYPFADLSVTGLTGPLVSAWSSLYVVVQQSNKVIKSINESSAADDVKQQYIAEARFMRGTAYWYLASLWGNVIISEDPTPLASNPVVNSNPQKDAFEFAIRDMEFAAKYLPEESGQPGRVNRYSAFGMLSRFYLAYSGFVASNYGESPNVGTRDQAYLDLAKKAAEKVINQGPFSLMENYPDLFKIEHNNNTESMFAFQWVPGLNSTTGYGVINTHQAYFAFGSEVTGDDAAWGDWTRCPYDMIKEYEENDTIRRKATWMGYGDFYPEINQANGGLLYERNVSGNSSTTLNVKKGVVGSSKDNPAIGRMNSALDNYMLRLAEVYLNYAEAVLGNNESTTDATALMYFNDVRTRAGLEAKTSISWEDIRHERRVEFSMEGRYWYDLLSRAYYKQQEIINYIDGQDRGTIPAYLFSAPNNLSIDSERNPGTRPVGQADASIFLLPYPESELIQNPKLGDAPVPYEFTEERITDLFE
ncbi:RagB/SusD family nutrient uptake outer membrane protein [Prolixibacter denitrificans]|uniref:Starch-binding protein n=1 Tax=Prolixibacter denitrificans TaxID=1541063 RepID=A0A2P8C644_9BACT|nr:RagB/SusD family nutrient uptake outer membrane protein [Prolixibacter denitrificans]PSK80439.1 putative outer membrane starch-binding protein [Prolixibacter denitrificans]GET23021.1 starch-binding protein [Prolixibacter denitrificans]